MAFTEDLKNQCLQAKTSQELKNLLRQSEIEIENILTDNEDLTALERNQIALIYYSNQKLPFLLGHKIKFALSDSAVLTIRVGIICGIVAIEKDVDINKLWIYDEERGTTHHIPLEDIVFPAKRINCHPDIKCELKRFISDPDYDKSLLLVPNLSSQYQDDNDDDDDRIFAGMAPTYRKPKLFSRDDTRTPWYELVDSDQPLCTVVESLFRLFTAFENEDIVLPIAVAASCQPSAISNYSQISVFYGLSGTGKSSCCHVIEGLYDIPKVLSSITYAGFRNHVNEHRNILSAEYSGERNIHVIIDEILPTTLENSDFYTLLKGGVSITTSEIRISSEKSGENKSFNCFCPKSFSTCNPFWQEQKYNEIRRRIFVFETKKVTDGDFVSKEEINYNECERKLSKVVEGFWVENQGKYKQFIRELRGDDRDILATICCLYSVKIPEAKKMLKDFRDVTQDKTHRPDARIEHLETYLADFVYSAASGYARAQRMGGIENPEISIKIKASELSLYFKQAASAGIFDKSLTDSKSIGELMIARGYELKHARQGGSTPGENWYWVKKYNPDTDLYSPETGE